ncbi:MAG: hypothetical protein ACLR8Y_02085 [Alistipes indistinctus]
MDWLAPLCRDYKVAILKTEREFFSDDKTTKSVNEVKDVPDNFKKWVKDNAERIAVAEYKGTTPYFLSENDKYVRLSELRSQLNLSQIRAAIARGEDSDFVSKTSTHHGIPQSHSRAYHIGLHERICHEVRRGVYAGRGYGKR